MTNGTDDVHGQRGWATTMKNKECVGSVFVTDQDPNTNKCNGRAFILLNRHQVTLREGESPSGDIPARKGAPGSAKKYSPEGQGCPALNCMGYVFNSTFVNEVHSLNEFSFRMKLPVHNYP